MRCKKCTKTFRSPPQRMRETQICAECSKTNFPTRNEVKEGSSVMIEKNRDSGSKNIDTIVTKGSGKWVEEDSTSDRNYEDINETISITVKNEKRKEEEDLIYLRKQQIQNHDKLVQINSEIESLKTKEKTIQKEIEHEEKNLEKYKEKGLSGFIRKFSVKNKVLVEGSEKFLSKKAVELEKKYSELNTKSLEENIYQTEEIKILEKIKQLEKKENKGEEDLSTVKPSWTSKKYDELQKLADAMTINKIKSFESDSSSTEKCEPIFKISDKNRSNITQIHVEDFLMSRNLRSSQPYRSVLMKFIKLANQFPLQLQNSQILADSTHH